MLLRTDLFVVLRVWVVDEREAYNARGKQALPAVERWSIGRWVRLPSRYLGRSSGKKSVVPGSNSEGSTLSTKPQPGMCSVKLFPSMDATVTWS